MPSLIQWLNSASDVWLAAVYTVVVQSVFVFAIAMVLTWLLSRLSAALRFWIWQIAALKLLIMPFSMIVVLPFWPPTPSPSPVTVTSPHVLPDVEMFDAEVPPIDVQLPPPTLATQAPPTELTRNAWICVCWMLLCLLQLVRCVRRKQQLTRFLSTCVPATESQLRRLKSLVARIDLKQPVHLVRGEVQMPLVTGVVSPTIILPYQLELDQGAFDQVVLHELAHVKRRDLLWIWLPEVLRMLFFFHPLAYWIQQQAKLHSEMACDELVLSNGSTRRAYAKTLLELVTRRVELPDPAVGPQV